MIGQKLGPYEITAKLGEGGMGEVYRATDTKLKRDVAIKVLPATFVEDKERLARFEREAQLLAQLHHPNIASIFGMEESEGTRALVMELVEGPTLAERLEQGPIPLNESLSLARQIAEALEEAHEKGIIHRDLKPQNIKASIEGKVKVLDFGLAKAMDPTGAASGAVSASQLAASPTLTLGATVQGVILGTAAYMSPEQARGGTADRRADVWAFGVVLWEMLTGESMFAADTVSDTLAGVLRDEIDLERLPAATPPAIHRLLRRCLERSPKNRLHSIADARLVIDDVLAGRADAVAPAEAGPPAIAAPAATIPTWRRALPWALAVLGFAGVAGLLILGKSSGSPATVLRADVGAPKGTRFLFQGDFGSPPVLSRDGTRIVFGAFGESGKSRLWVRSLVSGEERELAGTEGAFAPFFSPDARSVGYFLDGKLWTLAIDGGTPLRVADAPSGRGGAWAPDGSIVYAAEYRSPLLRIRASGGRPEPVTKVDETRHSSHRWPVLTTDGRAVVYLATNHDASLAAESELRWVRLDGGEDHALVPAFVNGVAAGGQLLFLRDGTLYSQALDPAHGRLSGEPVLVAQEILGDPSTWRAAITATADRLLYSSASQVVGSRLSLVDRTGRLLEELAPDDAYWDIALSPDGRYLAAGRGTPADLWLLDLERHTFGRFTFEVGDEFSPVWSRDGNWIYYITTSDPHSDMKGIERIYRKAVSGVGGAELVYETSPDLDVVPTDISPDGRRLLVSTGIYPFISKSDIAVLELDGSKRLTPLVVTPAVENTGKLSPDGRWLNYSSNESGAPQIYVRAFAPEGQSSARWQISIDGGYRTQWSPDGREIAFMDPNLGLNRVSVADDGAGGLTFGTPERLFSGTLMTDQQSYVYARDGQCFVLNHYGEEQSRPLRLIDNWRALLPR